MACHLLVNKLLPESMLTKTSHHMASLAHNVSNGHLIRNLHISSVLWPLCISCFNTGDVLHKEWCLTTDYHLHQDDPLQVSSLTTTSHIIEGFPYASWRPSLISFFSLARNGKWIKQASKQASQESSDVNIPVPSVRPSWNLGCWSDLAKAFMRLFQRDNSVALCWSFSMITQRIWKHTNIWHSLATSQFKLLVTVRKLPNLSQIQRFLEPCDLEIWQW